MFKKKKIYDLLKIFKDIRHKYDFELSVVGKGPEEKKLKQFVLLNRLDKNIKFYGSLPSEKISKLLDLNDFLLSCSKVETFGISIAEAMAKGIPAIVMNSGGPKDFLKNFNSISVSNFHEMKKVIIQNIIKKNFFNSKKISLHIKKNFSEKIIFNKFNKIFKKII